MNDRPVSVHTIPNAFGRIFLISMEEILGRAGVNAVLNQAHLSAFIDNYPPADLEPMTHEELFVRVGEALEGVYGVRGGRGLALRAGRASFKFYLREHGQLMNLEQAEFRLLPLDQKVRSGLKKIATFFTAHTGQQIALREDDTYVYWEAENCPFCWGRRTDSPVCQYQVGLLQSALYWLSGGRFYAVQEEACFAAGAPADVIRIDRFALD